MRTQSLIGIHAIDNIEEIRTSITRYLMKDGSESFHDILPNGISVGDTITLMFLSLTIVPTEISTLFFGIMKRNATGDDPTDITQYPDGLVTVFSNGVRDGLEPYDDGLVNALASFTITNMRLLS